MPRDNRGQKWKCIICGKTCKSQTVLLQHMNHPSSRCHPSLHPAILRAAEHVRGQIPDENDVAQADQNDATNDSMMDIDPPMDVDQEYNHPHDEIPAYPPANLRQEPVKLSMEPVKDYHQAAAGTFGKGETFLDNFRKDKYAAQREKHLYYPFASAAEWQFASFIVRSGLSLAKTDELLQQKLVRVRVFVAKDGHSKY